MLLLIGMGMFPLLFFTLVVLGVGVQWTQWAPPVVWNDRFGTSNGNGATAIVFDNSSLYVAGYLNVTEGPPLFGSNTPVWYGETFLSKYDLDGHTAWTSMLSNNYSSIQYDPPPPTSAISPWSNSVYAVANTNASSFLMKYDSSGNRVWISRFAGAFSVLQDVSAGVAGVYTIGRLDNSSELLQDHNFNGILTWSKGLNNSIGVNVSPLGEFVLTAGYLLRFDSGGNQLWSQPVSCIGCSQASLSVDGTGIYVLQDVGSIRKFATDGSVLWDAPLQFPIVAELGRISAGPSGVYVVYPGLIAKYDLSGKPIWSTRAIPTLRGWGFFEPSYLAAGQGGVYLAGSTSNVHYLGNASIEEIASDPSLIFIGINPPWSFVTIGGLFGTIVTGTVLFVKTSIRRANLRPRPARERKIRDMPSD